MTLADLLPEKLDRCWMYQLNPDKGTFDLGKGTEVATNLEGLRKEIVSGRIGPWYVTQHFDDAVEGDFVLIKIGGRDRDGAVAIFRIKRRLERRGEKLVEFVNEEDLTSALMLDPIPWEWLRTNIPKSQRNLVDVAPYWPEIRRQIIRTGEPDALDRARTDELYPEGKRKFVNSLRAERAAGNRDAVLAKRAQPLTCDVCGFCPAVDLGQQFADMLEVHHLKPVAIEERTPAKSDFAVLCARCHRAAHHLDLLHPLKPSALKRLLSERRMAKVRQQLIEKKRRARG